MERATYEPIEFLSEADAEAAIARDDPDELLYVPIAVSLHSERFEWAQAVCLALAAPRTWSRPQRNAERSTDHRPLSARE